MLFLSVLNLTFGKNELVEQSVMHTVISRQESMKHVQYN